MNIGVKWILLLFRDFNAKFKNISVQSGRFGSERIQFEICDILFLHWTHQFKIENRIFPVSFDFELKDANGKIAENFLRNRILILYLFETYLFSSLNDDDDNFRCSRAVFFR